MEVLMARFRYVGEVERIHLGPPVRVLSPGDVVEVAVNPDPALFSAVHADEGIRQGRDVEQR
jgi:hypothetical protein